VLAPPGSSAAKGAAMTVGSGSVGSSTGGALAPQATSKSAASGPLISLTV